MKINSIIISKSNWESELLSIIKALRISDLPQNTTSEMQSGKYILKNPILFWYS